MANFCVSPSCLISPRDKDHKWGLWGLAIRHCRKHTIRVKAAHGFVVCDQLPQCRVHLDLNPDFSCGSCSLQRRAELYQQSVKSFLDYFSKSERLITVDVTSGVADLIWNQVHDTMCELDFHPHRVVNTVVLFAFSKCRTSCVRSFLQQVE